MLGRACVERLADSLARVEFTDRRGDGVCRVDVRQDPAPLWRWLAQERYDLIVNAIGLLRGDMEGAGATLSDAIGVNSMFPHELSARAAGSPVVHISTDGVFSGRGGAPYDEASTPGPTDRYGASKWLGEPDAPGALTLRCSIVGGGTGTGRGLIDWFLSQPAGSRVSGFVDYLWTPATTAQLAQLLLRLAQRDLFERLRALSPVFHFAPNMPLSKWALLDLLNAWRHHDVHVDRGHHQGGAVDLRLTTRFDEFRQLYPEPRPWPLILSDILP